MNTVPREPHEPLESDARPEIGRHPAIRYLMQVLWPAFLGTTVTVGVLFSLVDPYTVDAVHVWLGGHRGAAYTAGFALLWPLYTLACSLTWLLATTDRKQRNVEKR